MAVNLLATSSYTCISSENYKAYRILKAGTSDEVKLRETGAVLIITSPENLLNYIEQIETDFNLPQGVKNRRREFSRMSGYWSGNALSHNVTTENIDRHIEYAKKAGLKTFYIYYMVFSESPGHYEWSPEYPSGMDDLRTIVKKIKNAGMVPGIRIHYNKAGITDSYVAPFPDPRLNLRRLFTLTSPPGKQETTIFVEENPAGKPPALC